MKTKLFILSIFILNSIVLCSQTNNAINKSTKVDEYGICTDQCVDLGLKKCWAGYNIGATKPEESGNFYAWGEIKTKKKYTKENSSSFNIRMKAIHKSPFKDVAFVSWKNSWHLPTYDELMELKENCTWEWITYKKKNGYKVKGPNGVAIFLPAGGYIKNYITYNSNTEGHYWSSIPEDKSNCSYILYFFEGYYNVFDSYREIGRNVRAVLD